MPIQLEHLWSARAKHVGIRRIPSYTLPRRAAYFSDGTHTRLPLLASTMAKVSSVCTLENSQPAHSDGLCFATCDTKNSLCHTVLLMCDKLPPDYL